MRRIERSRPRFVAAWLGTLLIVAGIVARTLQSGRDGAAWLVALLIAAGSIVADPKPEATLLHPDGASPDEPRVDVFSAALAADYLDVTAGDWAATRRCAACHTIPPYLMARPVLDRVKPDPGDVRAFVERVVVDRLEGEPSLPPDGISAILVQVATSLAINDRSTTGKLHPVTRQALDRIWTRQRDDGSWEWPFRDVPPIKIDEHYGVTLAAIGVGAAPDGYAQTETARTGLAKIRRYLQANPPVSLHQRAMLAWAAGSIDDLMTASERRKVAENLLAAQRPDGGWSLASLVETGSPAGNASEALRELQAKSGYGSEFLTYVGRTGAYASPLASDGYATGFVIYVARQIGVPADDLRLARGVSWLKRNQRKSGRWFTPSQGNHTHHYVSNAGTAYAVMALDACGALIP